MDEWLYLAKEQIKFYFMAKYLRKRTQTQYPYPASKHHSAFLQGVYLVDYFLARYSDLTGS